MVEFKKIIETLRRLIIEFQQPVSGTLEGCESGPAAKSPTDWPDPEEKGPRGTVLEPRGK